MRALCDEAMTRRWRCEHFCDSRLPTPLVLSSTGNTIGALDWQHHWCSRTQATPLVLSSTGKTSLQSNHDIHSMGFWLWGLGSHLCSTIVGSAEEEIATVRVPDRGHLEHVPSKCQLRTTPHPRSLPHLCTAILDRPTSPLGLCFGKGLARLVVSGVSAGCRGFGVG